jgi:hypothetical protein
MVEHKNHYLTRQELLQAALRVITCDLQDEHGNADADAQYADERLALAARDHFRAIDATPQVHPVGWGD